MKKQLKIAYFMDNFFPQINGVVTSSINTAKECVNRGHKIFAVVPDSKIMYKCPGDYFPYPVHYEKGSEAFFYPDFIFTNPFSMKTLKKMHKFKPDIIHYHATFTIGYQAIRIAKKLGIPVIGTFHTFFAEPEYLSVIGLEKMKFLVPIGWWFSNMFFNNCDAVVSPGKETARIISGKNLKSKLHVISNGVEVQKYKKFKFNSKQFPLDVKSNEEWIIYIGRVSREKCLDVLFDAFKIVTFKRPKARLLIVGDGPSFIELQKMAYNIGISDKIFFSGKIPNKDFLESGILQKMKLFVSASTSENQPMTILESIMFGLPIVGVNAKGIPELIEGNGFITPPNNPSEIAEKIIKILSNRTLHKKFSDKSLSLAKKYDIKVTTNKMEKLYYDVIEEKR